MSGIKRRTSGAANCMLRGRGKRIPNRPVLPLVHVTSTGRAREVIVSGQLEARECPVFSRPLLYFFAYRPAYRRQGETQKSDQVGRFPAVFIADSTDLGPPY